MPRSLRGILTSGGNRVSLRASSATVLFLARSRVPKAAALICRLCAGARRHVHTQDFRTAARESRNRCYRKITPFWRAARRAFLLLLIKIGRKRSIMGMREHPMELMWQDPTE